MQTIKALSDSMEHLSEHTKHLPVIAKGIEVMTDKITDMNSTVLSAAIGREQIPLSTVNEMFNQWSKHNATLYRVFGVICLSLVLIIGYLLIGEHFSWIRNLH